VSAVTDLCLRMSAMEEALCGRFSDRNFVVFPGNVPVKSPAEKAVLPRFPWLTEEVVAMTKAKTASRLAFENDKACPGEVPASVLAKSPPFTPKSRDRSVEKRRITLGSGNSFFEEDFPRTPLRSLDYRRRFVNVVNATSKTPSESMKASHVQSPKPAERSVEVTRLTYTNVKGCSDKQEESMLSRTRSPSPVSNDAGCSPMPKVVLHPQYTRAVPASSLIAKNCYVEVPASKVLAVSAHKVCGSAEASPISTTCSPLCSPVGSWNARGTSVSSGAQSAAGSPNILECGVEASILGCSVEDHSTDASTCSERTSFSSSENISQNCEPAFATVLSPWRGSLSSMPGVVPRNASTAW